jgi:hypothetical protein
MYWQIGIGIVSLFALIFAVGILSIITRQERRSLKKIFLIYICVVILFGGIYYIIYVVHIYKVASSFIDFTTCYDKPKAPEEVIKKINEIIKKSSSGPFIISRELEEYSLYIKDTLALNDPKAIANQIMFLSKLLSEEQILENALNKKVPLSEEERRILLKVITREVREKLTKLLSTPPSKWDPFWVSWFRNRKGEAFSAWSSLLKNRFTTAVNLYRTWNTGGRTYINFLYFSLVTITTLGYGDILPNQPFVRLIVMIELVLGLSLTVFFVASSRKLS